MTISESRHGPRRAAKKKRRGQARKFAGAALLVAGLGCAGAAAAGFVQQPAPRQAITAAPVHPFTADAPDVAGQSDVPPTLPPRTLAFPNPERKTDPAASPYTTVPLLEEGLDAGGWLVIPDSDRGSHYTATAPLGAARGSSLIAAHVNYPSGKLAPMSGLGQIEKGAGIYVTDRAGALHRYRATTLSSIRKDRIPTSFYALDGPPRLTLITCDQASGIAPVWGVEQFQDVIAVTAVPWP